MKVKWMKLEKLLWPDDERQIGNLIDRTWSPAVCVPQGR